MKTLYTTLLGTCLSVMLGAGVASGHSLKEGLNMIEWQAVDLTRVIVKVKEGYDLDINAKSIALSPSADGLRAGEITAISTAPYRMGRLFKSMEATFQAERQNPSLRSGINLANYAEISFLKPVSAREARSVLKKLYKNEAVAFAHFDAKTANAVIMDEPVDESAYISSNYPAGPVPDFTDKQFYLTPAPDGVDATFGQSQPGGDGSGVHVIDIEWGWQDNHVDFKAPFFELQRSRTSDHGTAVWGIVAAKKDGQGITGIAPGVEFGTGRFTSTPDTYMQVAEQLKDKKDAIIIIEQHKQGPDGGKWAPNEYWQETFDAFKKITSEMGIHIIAASGNGGSNLDGEAYEGAFDMKKRDSGAILVGAGHAPSPMSSRRKLGFSNYGSRLDAMGYGHKVCTTGYGQLHGKGNKTEEYTGGFGGTSSATPIVVGAAASVVGMAQKAGKKLKPIDVRNAMRATGSPQTGNTEQRIGSLPDIKALKAHLGL